MGWIFKRNGIDVSWDGVFENATAELATYNLAIHTAIDLIAKTISKCEFQIYKNKKPSNDIEHYLFNYEPNQNQNATQFWYKVIERILFSGEALVIKSGENMYVADSFTKDTPTFKEWKFKDVQIDDITLKKTYSMKEVFYFSYSSKNMEHLLNQYYKAYGKMLGSSIRYYNRSRASKWTYRIKTVLGNITKENSALDDKMRSNMSKFVQAEDSAVMPLGDGQELSDVSSKPEYDSRDSRSLVNDIFEIVAIAFHIPKSLMMGDGLETGENMDNFITFALEPLIELIQDEVNRKYFRQDEVSKGNFFKIYANRIKHVDVINAAQKLESLFRIGFSYNDLLKILGEEPLNEAWANERFVTKNYMTVASSMKGGE